MILIQSVLRFLRRKPDQPAQPAPGQPRPEDRPAQPGQDKDRERQDQDKP